MRNLIFALIVGLLVLIFLPRDTKDALFGSWTIFSQQDNVGTIKITGTIAHSFFDHEMIPVILCGNNGQKSWIPCKPSIYKSAVEANSLVEKGWVVEVVIAAKPRFWSLFGNQELWITEFHQVSLPSQLKNPLPQRINHGGGFRKVYREKGHDSRGICVPSTPRNQSAPIWIPQTPSVTPQNIIHIENDGDGNVFNITIGDDRKTINGNTLSEPSRPTNNKDTLHSGIPTVSF
jgi:hypothetical protein